MSNLSKANTRGAEFPHAERELAEQLGVAQSVLKGIRDQVLQRGEHWELVKNVLRYSEAGKNLVLSTLPGPDDSAANAPGEGLPPALPAAGVGGGGYVAPQAGEIRILKVVRTVRNRHQVAALDGEVAAWVRVKDSRKFSGGMEIRAKFLEVDRWIIEGRGPRFRGRY